MGLQITTRLTRAQFTARTSAHELVPGRVYIITDEANLPLWAVSDRAFSNISEPVGSTHSQNTDTGTSATSFGVDTGSVLGKWLFSVLRGAANKILTFTNLALTDNRTVTFKDESGIVAFLTDINGKVSSFVGDLKEYLGSKILAGTNMTINVVEPKLVTMTDELYADYAAFVVGKSIDSGSRFSFQSANVDTTDNYFAGVKGSALEINDIFEDRANTTAVYLGNNINCYQLELEAASGTAKPIKNDATDLVYDMDYSIITTSVGSSGAITFSNAEAGSYIYQIINTAVGQITITMPTGGGTYCYAATDTINAGEVKQLKIVYDGTLYFVSLADDLTLNAGGA